MLMRQLFDESTHTFTYLLADETSGDAVLIDAVAEQHERDQTLLRELGLTLRYTLETHVHADHVTAASAHRKAVGAKTVVSKAGGAPCADVHVEHGDRIAFGAHEIEVRATPGHTAGCVTYVVRDGDRTFAFTGDALFVRGCGRTDFQGGCAVTLYHSVHEQIFSLPDDTIIYPGHDYRGHCCSTVGEEKRLNPRLRLAIDEETFVATMQALDLPHPKHIAVALPANLACGEAS